MAIDLTDKLDEATRAARTDAAIAAPPTLGSAPFTRAEPDGGALSGPAGGIVGNPFGPKSEPLGSGLFQIDSSLAPGASGKSQQPAKPGRDASGIITADSGGFAQNGISYNVNATSQDGVKRVTAPGTSPLYTNIDPQMAAGAMAGMKSGQMRIGDGFNLAEQNERMAKSLGYAGTDDFNKKFRERQEFGSDLSESGRIALRGQDVTAHGYELNAQNHQESNRLSAVRAGIDMGRFGLEKQAAQRQQQATDALAQATASGDQAAIARARQAAASAGLKVEPLQHVETDRGLMTFDPRTGQMTPATGTDGAPVGGGKALTEFQGKSAAYGMRANDASQIIDTVGQNGKVQPSLLKRGAETVPLIGEGLGMVANKLQTPEQQQVEQAQRGFINSVLRQESGAAISASEFDNARKQYFPQPNDTPEVIEQKRLNREKAIDGFRVSAGPGAKHIGAPAQAPAQAQPAQAQQQAAAGPKVGHIDGKHIYVGGNPADPASWVETR